jgi:hypothetical protein
MIVILLFLAGLLWLYVIGVLAAGYVLVQAVLVVGTLWVLWWLAKAVAAP